MRLNLHQEITVRIHITALKLGRFWSYKRLRAVTRLILRSEMNAVVVGLILANGSFLWALSSWLTPSIFLGEQFSTMRSVASGAVWGWAFLLHFLLTYWRTYDPVERPRFSLMVNIYGFCLWFFANASLVLHEGILSPSTALQASVCFASAWVLYKTGTDNND
jgi:hypothetical protein